MFRLTLCALFAASAVLAAPAPFPRSGKESSWVSGWDNPVDPLGDCAFARSGDKLTISVPGGRDHIFLVGLGRDELAAPRLLRNIEGDFAAEVVVGGNFGEYRKSRRAGLVLLAGEDFGAKLVVTAYRSVRKPYLLLAGSCRSPGHGYSCESEGPKFGETAILRLERRGQTLLMKANLDGKTWSKILERRPETALPAKVKIGVVAESDDTGIFRAEFSRFRLTRPER